MMNKVEFEHELPLAPLLLVCPMMWSSDLKCNLCLIIPPKGTGVFIHASKHTYIFAIDIVGGKPTHRSKFMHINDIVHFYPELSDLLIQKYNE
jgi:hypothetical protein